MDSNKELWQITYKWLKNCGNKISQNYLKEELTTHPDYPALVSVADFLDQGKFKYNAVHADASCKEKFNYPLLAHFKQPGHEYLQIINGLNEWNEVNNRFWSGIVIYPEINSKWNSLQNSSYLKNEFNNKITIYFILLLGLTLVSYTSFQFDYIFSILFFGILSIIGIIFSIFSIGIELGYQSQVVKQVCGTESASGSSCEKVLKSRFAKGLFGITPADASIIYFTSQLFMYLLSQFFLNFLSWIMFISFFGFIIALWSLYTQAIKIKKYCVLCLCIVIVLMSQFFISYYVYQSGIFKELNYNLIITQGTTMFVIFSFILLLIFFPIKNLIKINKKNKIKIIELKKWKLDAGLFINSLKQEQLVDIQEWENDLILGDSNAPILITVACNLYCMPCAKTHIKLDELLVKYNEFVKIQFRLFCNSKNNKDIKTISVSKILQKNHEVNNKHVLQNMLNDWFQLMNLEEWSKKWNTNSIIDVSNEISNHSNWVIDNSISQTPTLFINGRKIPSRYTIDDFEALIPQLANLI